MLHDTIEDTETTSEELRAMFGQKVASVVMEVTDDKSLEKSVRKQRQVSAVSRPVVVELVAGTTIPSVRHFSQRVIHQFGGRLVRINPNECDVPTRLDVGLRMGASDGLASIAKALGAEWGLPAAGGGDGRR